jgi:hypothetical protein
MLLLLLVMELVVTYSAATNDMMNTKHDDGSSRCRCRRCRRRHPHERFLFGWIRERRDA